MLKAQDPKLYEKIKQHREIVSESQELIKRTTTDLSPEQRRRISEERMKKVMADLRDNQEVYYETQKKNKQKSRQQNIQTHCNEY